jgi:PIN domain nuclease of toxin-antitoxin system
VRGLLDTHAILWLLSGDARLGLQARAFIDDADNVVLASIVSLWEIAIKIGVGKRRLDGGFRSAMLDQLPSHDIGVLPMETRHLVDLLGLPHHHRDPFDRLLAAQCLADELVIVSIDEAFDAYGIHRIW